MSVINFPFYGNAIYGAFINLPTGVPDGTLAVTLDTYSLWVYNAGTATWGGVNDQPSSPILAPNGSAALPSYSFASDPDTGMFRAGANEVAFSCGGLQQFSFLGGQLFPAIAGSASAPTYAMRADVNTGMYGIAADTLGFTTGGTLALTLSSAQAATFAGAVTVTGVASFAAGAVGAPGVAVGQATTGLYLIGASDLGVAVGGVKSLEISGLDVVVGNAAIATNATSGFFWVDACAGTPTGTPAGLASFTGRIPMVYDSTNNFLYVYSGGGWKKSTVYA